MDLEVDDARRYDNQSEHFVNLQLSTRYAKVSHIRGRITLIENHSLVRMLIVSSRMASVTIVEYHAGLRVSWDRFGFILGAQSIPCIA